MLSFYTLSKKDIFCSYFEPLSFFNNCVGLKMDVRAEGRLIKHWGQLFFLGNGGNFSTSYGIKGTYAETDTEVFCIAEEVLYYA